MTEVTRSVGIPCSLPVRPDILPELVDPVLEPVDPVLEPGFVPVLPAPGLDVSAPEAELLLPPILEPPPCSVPVISTRLFTYCFRLSPPPERRYELAAPPEEPVRAPAVPVLDEPVLAPGVEPVLAPALAPGVEPVLELAPPALAEPLPDIIAFVNMYCPPCDPELDAAPASPPACAPLAPAGVRHPVTVTVRALP